MISKLQLQIAALHPSIRDIMDKFEARIDETLLAGKRQIEFDGDEIPYQVRHLLKLKYEQNGFWIVHINYNHTKQVTIFTLS